MQQLYRPKQGLRIPLPGGTGEWPKDGRPLNPASPYERRLEQDGDLVLIETPAAPASSGGKTGGLK
tara:strand:- start:20215 stop:20412 length:198 start_codon:yes stop_codon:yes gene_type:complete